MTCIVGLEHGGKVYMGGDRCCSTETFKTSVSRPKVFKAQKLLIGFAGSFRFRDLLEYHLKLPKQSKKMSDEKYMITVVLEEIRELMLEKNPSEDHESDSNCLLGYNGKLYELQVDYSLIETSCGYNAVGLGREYALGSLYSNEGQDPELRILTALQASAEFCPGVAGPFDIIKQK